MSIICIAPKLEHRVTRIKRAHLTLKSVFIFAVYLAMSCLVCFSKYWLMSNERKKGPWQPKFPRPQRWAVIDNHGRLLNFYLA